MEDKYPYYKTAGATWKVSTHPFIFCIDAYHATSNLLGITCL